MIDVIYRIVQTLANKENNGYVSPLEFNLLAHKAQEEIFSGYFEDENRDKIRQNRGTSNQGYSNLPLNQRQKIDQFAAIATLTYNGTIQGYNLPANIYFIEDDGLISATGKVVEEVERKDFGYLANTSGAASETYPVYERYNNFIRVLPVTLVTPILCRYLRKPTPPKWTYTVVSGKELFNPSANDYQDFELHPSELSNLTLKILSYFGLTLREEEVIQVAETMKNTTFQKENG